MVGVAKFDGDRGKVRRWAGPGTLGGILQSSTPDQAEGLSPTYFPAILCSVLGEIAREAATSSILVTSGSEAITSTIRLASNASSEATNSKETSHATKASTAPPRGERRRRACHRKAGSWLPTRRRGGQPAPERFPDRGELPDCR